MKKLSKNRKFKLRPLHKKRELHPLQYLSQRATFWVAVISVFAFVTGNMMGQHGWQVFWKSVLGQTDDSLIVYTGTVPPVARVPDYSRWSTYGGNAQVHLFSEVPTDLLIPLPSYNSAKEQVNGSNSYYSVGYMGSYATGAEGSGVHPGVDIRVPVGTPIQSIANGIVTEVGNDSSGFGKYIVIRHPHVPDPLNPGKTTVLYSCYAHMSETDVQEGDIVRKTQLIGLSGQTGDATGPHLHFQIDRDIGIDGKTVPFHPYWPFTGMQARLAGMSSSQAIDSKIFQANGYANTVNPMVFVQANLAEPTTVVLNTPSSTVSSTDLVAQRKAALLAKRGITSVAMASSVSSSSIAASVAGIVAGTEDVVLPAAPSVVSSSSSQSTASAAFSAMQIDHASSFNGQQWETITITLLDDNGQVVAHPSFDGKLYLRTSYGDAQYRPDTLSVSDFKNGVAQVKMLPLSHRTVIVEVQPGAFVSTPMKFEK